MNCKGDFTYTERPSPVDTVIDLFRASGANAPVDDRERFTQMLDQSQYVLSAWDGHRLAGLIRVLTDVSFNAFIADLVVHPDYQRRGLGSELVRRAVTPYPGVKFAVHPGRQAVAALFKKQGFNPAPTSLTRRRFG
jgi:ribosomal protein S18 acetylase RimI-like enzyme